MTDPFEVYAIRYATVTRRAAENFIGGDAHEAGTTMDYFVWLVRNGSSSYVVDTGFNAAAAERRRRQFLRCPSIGLQALGVDAATAPDVLVTHLHYDHIGNFDLFPAARFHLQDAEMAFATGRHMAHHFFSHSYELDEVLAMVRNVYAGRVMFHAGDHALCPGLSLHLIGGHTAGLQAVRVWTRVGWLVLASDASHYYANMQSGRPFPIVADVKAMVDGWQRLRELVDDPCHIIPGHDPQVMQRYSAPSPDQDGWIVRLDDTPRPV
ncbi:MAG: N-acyl homoserine lactonase family protein [Gammaproteobacteria bacterium]|nr:N-acyl homoserine lactonase family protein [Gammaproteobacteria bacterium]